MATGHLSSMMPFGTAPASFPGRGPLSLGTGGVPTPPAGFVFLIDADGAYLTDADGAYLMEPV